ncbi:MAG: hypothetical protein ACQCN6_00350 [Candidatus Bathyarchaeia archaeon]|jgi:hypothetical protein
MVRAYILTEREKTILQRYIDTGENNGFDILIHYLNKYQSELTEDINLIENAIKQKSAHKTNL